MYKLKYLVTSSFLVSYVLFNQCYFTVWEAVLGLTTYSTSVQSATTAMWIAMRQESRLCDYGDYGIAFYCDYGIAFYWTV